MTQATIRNVTVGAVLTADDGFTCIASGVQRRVQSSAAGALFVPCGCGRHYLDGQLNEAGEYVGFSLAKPQ